MSKIKSVVKNWWAYYFVKWGLCKRANLKVKVSNGLFNIDINQFNFQRTKFFIKALLRLKDKFQYFSNSDKILLIKVSPGIRFLIRPIINDIGILEELFVKDEYACLYPYIKDSVILDIGAYIGDSSVLFCSRGAKKVYAYEPHPDLYKMAVANIKLDNLEDRVNVANYGVGGRKEALEVNEGVSGATSCFGGEIGPKGRSVRLNILPLIEILNNIGKVDIIKMDCEGAEFEAILSCPVEPLKQIKAFLLEYHREPTSLIEYFKKAGFRVSKVGQEFKGVGLLFATNTRD